MSAGKTLQDSETVPGKPLIRFENVSIGFEEGDVLRGISFEVAPGETKVVLGESGSGKSVLLKLGAALLRPDSGRVLVMGRDLAEMNEVGLLDFRRRIGFVFQEGALFDSLGVADNVSFRLREEAVSIEETEQRVREALRFVEMEEAYDKFPSELSGGMRRRVSIARAIVDQPPIVYYDSPTAGLDPVTSQTIITLILRLRDRNGVTSLLATHRLQDAFGLANFVFEPKENRVMPVWEDEDGLHFAPTNFVVLRGGEIYFQGATTDLLKSSDPYLQKFLA
ncbi:MAG TPA: ATP-binding cassette domain-containing protein [Candidatus Acidoferrales bacterium]|nr:ATP-binding cassette domain-containing protein [Candidatus Acidoferrales bacterium]